MTTQQSYGSITDQPAAHLLGLELVNGWRVTELLVPEPGHTGGAFSVGYLAERTDVDGLPTGELGFVKAIDFSKWREFGTDFVSALKAMTESFTFERELVEKCTNRRMRNVIRGYCYGEVVVGSGPIAPVNYIVFEHAERDIRRHLDRLTVFDEAWGLRVLHNVASGQNQLQLGGIYHQDLKPSNILVVDGGSKLGDLGRAYDRELPSPHEHLLAPGDRSYTPPECWYEFFNSDRIQGCRAVELYHLGSMVTFMFTRVSMTVSIATNLDPRFYPQTWTGTFDEVLPYLRNAFDEAVTELELQLPGWLRSGMAVLVRQLCDPDPRLRGNARHAPGTPGRMSLEYYISRLDFFTRKAELELGRAIK